MAVRGGQGQREGQGQIPTTQLNPNSLLPLCTARPCHALVAVEASLMTPSTQYEPAQDQPPTQMLRNPGPGAQGCAPQPH